MCIMERAFDTGDIEKDYKFEPDVATSAADSMLVRAGRGKLYIN